MTYHATVYSSLRELKLRRRGLGGWIGGISGLVFAVLPQVFPLAVVMTVFAWVCLGLAILVISGLVPVRRQHRGLKISPGELTVTGLDGDEVTVRLSALQPRARVASFRPFLMPFKMEYLILEVAGGPLGPRRFYFVHDGDYAAKAWAKLEIEHVETLTFEGAVAV